MAVPTKTIVNQTYEGESIQCAKISCTESSDFKFTNAAPVNDNYQFQTVIRSTGNKTISVTLGGVTKTITISGSFRRYTLSFMGTIVTSSKDLIMSFPTGDYWIYNVQLERATSPSGWRPAPEDAADDATVIAGSIAEDKAAAALEAQTQADIFNKLTNNGQVQGLYMAGGKIYLNATYIQTGTLSIKKNNVETFYANADTGVIRIKADEFSLSSGETLASTLSSAESYADSASASAASSAVNAQTQEFVFNKLTNNGQTQGIYLSGGKVYINASYISTGTLSADRIASGSITSAKLSSAVITSISNAQSAADTAQSTANGANNQTQIVYISKASGTTSVSAPTSWVTNTTGNQNTWTIKRPVYNSSYPVCFVATQSKTVAGTVSCTTPQIDQTTTVIDGGHITTGTIDASVVSVTNLNASNITSGTISATKISGGTLQDSGGNFVLNLSTGALAAKKLSITSTNFTLTEAGAITAKSGTIAGWTIASAALYNGMTSLADTTHNGVWLGTDGIAVGKGNFKVTNAGALTAKSGTVGGFTIDSTSIRSAALNSTSDNAVGISTANFTRSINGTSRTSLVFAIGGKFGVSNAGVLYASDVVLSGKITSTSGSSITATLESGCNVTPIASSVVSAAQAQIETIIANKVTANYITAQVAVLGSLSARSDGIGVSGTVYASGNISASTVYASGGYQTLGANGVSATVSLKDPNGNTAASLVFTNGIITSAGGTYQFNCTKTFYYSKTQKTIYAYASSTSTSRIAYSFDYVSSISSASGGTSVTI